MPWDRPTLQQLHERISRDFSGRLLDGAAPLPRSVIGVLAKVWAGASHSQHGMLEWLYGQIFPDVAEGPYLESWAAVWGVYRKSAAAASGLGLFSGSAGAVIPAGWLLQRQANGQKYALKADAVLDAAGAASAPVEALEAGSGGNLPGGAALSLAAPVAGAQSKALAGPEGLTGGVDIEADAELRARLLARLRRPPRGGSKADWEAWALEVPGVTRAWCYPLGAGIGTVSLTFVCDNAESVIPSADMAERVRQHLAPLAPAGVKEFEVFAPEPLPLVIRLRITPDTAAVREAVSAELHDLIAREAAPGAVIYRSHISEAVSLAAGELDHTLLEPAANVQVQPGFFPMLEEVEFEEAL